MTFREERIGGQRLILGDCLEVMKTLGRVDEASRQPDMFIAPPPKPVQEGLL